MYSTQDKQGTTWKWSYKQILLSFIW